MARLRRSLHFVPGANERMFEKALGLPADALILDLEDAVTPDQKEAARRTVASWLAERDFGARERIVRMNPLDSPWGRRDVEETMEHPPDAYLVPKVRALAEVDELDTWIAQLEAQLGHAPGRVKLIVLGTETPQGALNIASLAECERVEALTWGAEDLSAALGARRNRDEGGRYLEVFRYCRTMTLLSARAAGVEPLDTVYVDVRDLDGLRRESQEAAWMGFSGKLTIHPAQIEVVNQVFTPTPEEVADAQELVAAFEAHQREGRMTFAFRGQMVDVPHLERARALLERARLAGLGA